jgi:1-acyl-sn-glycerol-3-phosphate acyltransferase
MNDSNNSTEIIKEREPLSSLFYYRAFKWSVVTPMFYLYFGGKIYGLEKVPQKGKLIIVSNHASDYDPPLLAAHMNRPVAFMAKEELFKVPLLGEFIKLYGAFPVNRNAVDRNAIRTALKFVDEGWSVGLFMQGTRTEDGVINDPKLGAALIAAKAKAPILPVSLWGTEKIVKKGEYFPKKVPVTIRIGDLLPAPRSTKKEDLEEVTKQCTDIINGMHALGR